MIEPLKTYSNKTNPHPEVANKTGWGTKLNTITTKLNNMYRVTTHGNKYKIQVSTKDDSKAHLGFALDTWEDIGGWYWRKTSIDGTKVADTRVSNYDINKVLNSEYKCELAYLEPDLYSTEAEAEAIADEMRKPL